MNGLRIFLLLAFCIPPGCQSQFKPPPRLHVFAEDSRILENLSKELEPEIQVHSGKGNTLSAGGCLLLAGPDFPVSPLAEISAALPGELHVERLIVGNHYYTTNNAGLYCDQWVRQGEEDRETAAVVYAGLCASGDYYELDISEEVLALTVEESTGKISESFRSPVAKIDGNLTPVDPRFPITIETGFASSSDKPPQLKITRSNWQDGYFCRLDLIASS